MTLSQLESSQRASQEHLQTNSTNKDKVPAVRLNSHDMVYGKEEYWLPSYIEDRLYVEMCKKEIEDPQGKCGEKTSKYYLEAAKYARRISAGDFSQLSQGSSDGNAVSGPVFLLELKDFSPRLIAELAHLYKTDKELLDSGKRSSL